MIIFYLRYTILAFRCRHLFCRFYRRFVKMCHIFFPFQANFRAKNCWYILISVLTDLPAHNAVCDNCVKIVNPCDNTVDMAADKGGSRQIYNIKKFVKRDWAGAAAAVILLIYMLLRRLILVKNIAKKRSKFCRFRYYLPLIYIIIYM